MIVLVVVTVLAALAVGWLAGRARCTDTDCVACEERAVWWGDAAEVMTSPTGPAPRRVSGLPLQAADVLHQYAAARLWHETNVSLTYGRSIDEHVDACLKSLVLLGLLPEPEEEAP